MVGRGTTYFVKTKTKVYTLNVLETGRPMDNVISLKSWKRKKQEEEVDELSKKVKDIIDELDIDMVEVSQPYFTELTGYDNLGLPVSHVMLEPNVKSCCSTLAWVSYVLIGLGEKDAANEVDSIVEKLEAKSITRRE